MKKVYLAPAVDMCTTVDLDKDYLLSASDQGDLVGTEEGPYWCW